MKMVLIGFMGSGKSAVAKKLGGLLNWPIIEMDELILKKTNTKSMDEVFAKGGELLLRETEIAVAKECAAIKDIVISTGGGVVLNKIILDYFKESKGQIHFLNASFQTIANRLANDYLRPLFKNEIEAKSLFQFRLPLYFKYADQVVEVDEKSVDEIAQEIMDNSLKDRSYG